MAVMGDTEGTWGYPFLCAGLCRGGLPLKYFLILDLWTG